MTGTPTPLKVAVYAIALNEAQHAERFMSTASEADMVVVADTGSTDGTPELLRSLGAVVHHIRISPWRFDDARNAALALVPADMDVCAVVDLDEVLDPGWAESVRSRWVPGRTTRGTYTYVWSHNADGTLGVTFRADRLHARHGFRWVHPCHEVVIADRTAETVADMGFTLHHWPDETKSRGQYLPLLEVAAAERPDDPRTAHYLGREYHYRGMWQEAVKELRRHLDMPSSVWAPERSASMRYISGSMRALGKEDDALDYARRAAQEAPNMREGWLCYAQLCHDLKRWDECLSAAENAAAITDRPDLYLTEPWAWGALPYDLASVAAWNAGRHEAALAYCRRAAELDPADQRIAGNLALLERLLTT